MRMRPFKRLRFAVLVLAVMTAATPAWAGFFFSPTYKQNFDVFLPGVDCYGCLTDCGGKCTTFCAVINVCTGKFTGTAKACVKNKSWWFQCYENVNFFKDYCVRVECSDYSVGILGNAKYTASGCIGSVD